MACGCAEVCTCYLISSDTVDVSGSGTSASPWVAVVIADPNGGIYTGVNGVGVLIDPASTLPWSLGPAGLKLDCCPVAVLDSDTINFDLSGGAVTGDVIPDPNGGIENTPNGVAIKVDPSSTADVSTGAGGLKVDVDPAVVVASAWDTGDYKLSVGTLGAGWLECDGSLVLSASYPDLDAIIGSGGGHVFNGGVNPGGGQFKLPDLRGRVPVMPDGGAGRLTTNNALGNTGGAEAVTLTAAQSGVPAHGHTVNDPTHDHIVGWNRITTGDIPLTGTDSYVSGLVSNGGGTNQVNTTADATGVSVNNNAAQNAASSHTNVQPYQVAGSWYIRT